MKIDGAKIAKPRHHHISAIMDRVEKSKAAKNQTETKAKEPNHGKTKTSENLYERES